MMYAPIVLFAFNRLEPLKRCVASLLDNSEAAETELFVFVDGPRANKTGEAEKVESVRQFVKEIKGFKTIETHFSDVNHGLGSSLIAGINEIINRYGRAIVVEDDLVCSKNFLAFLNQGLDYYENKKEVFSISSETVKIKAPEGYAYDNYFAPRAGCWGWATWKDRWETVDFELKDWKAVRRNKRKFNNWGGSDCFKLLEGWHTGKNKSWAIRFNYAQFLQHATSVFPMVSKVSNEGFDEGGTNCKPTIYNRFAMKGDESGRMDFKFNPDTKELPFIVRQRLFPVRLTIRIFAKIVNMFAR